MKSTLPLVYYRLPHEKKVYLLQSESPSVEIDSLEEINRKQGFILYPFSPDGASKPLFIEAGESIIVSLNEIDESIPDWGGINGKGRMSSYKTKEEYCKNVANAIEEIRSGGIRKVVLSRLKRIENHTKTPLAVFHKLCIKYPAAFVSLVYIPDRLLWITATPELLVSADSNNIRTVSLAGTKPLDDNEEWGNKEKIEQQVVTEYINEMLKKHCSNITISGPDEIVAGNVKHLKTSFSATLNTDLWSFVSALHPTPAVCGIPLDRAKQFIAQSEGYDRKYYTGFLGPCNMDGKTDLFVNLRCAEIFDNYVNLYIGGGITKDSIPEKEWEETELKSKTLLFAFEEDEKK